MTIINCNNFLLSFTPGSITFTFIDLLELRNQKKILSSACSKENEVKDKKAVVKLIHLVMLGHENNCNYIIFNAKFNQK